MWSLTHDANELIYETETDAQAQKTHLCLPWSGLPFPSPADLTNLGIEPGSPTL